MGESILRKIRIGVLVITASVLVFSSSTTVYAIDEQFYSANDILYYGEGGACAVAGATLNSPAPAGLQGETNAEKVWNYFVGRGLTPIAAAGAMGNIEQESGFDPWIGEKGSTSINKSDLGVGFGLIQWTNTDGDETGRRYGVMKYMEDNGVSLNATDPAQLDRALLYQLNWLWDGEYGSMTWQEQINREVSVEGDTSVDKYNAPANEGNGSALYFHAAVERSADGHKGLQERIDSARVYLDEFGSGTGAGECGYGSGGMTMEQARDFMSEYITSDEVDQLVGEQKEYCNEGPHGWRANCVTFSRYFMKKMTSLEPAQGNGGDIAPNTAAENGADLGTTPRPYAVFSMPLTEGDYTEYGHTGVVAAVDTAKGTMIIMEASCNAGGPNAVSDRGWEAFVVREVPIDSLPSGTVYLYTESHMNAVN